MLRRAVPAADTAFPVAGERTYFEQAADALRRAMRATHIGEQSVLLEEALRLNRLALAEERTRIGPIPPTNDGAAT